MLNSEKIHDGGVIKIWPATSHPDPRGSFTELYRAQELAEVLGKHDRGAVWDPPDLVQMNLSMSGPSVLRGMHYHSRGHQAKFLRPLIGDIYQVSVDCRKHSDTFGSWVGTYLRAANNEAIWVPAGFANGFVTFAQGSMVLYQMTMEFNPEIDCGFRWDDQAVNIKWPMGHGAPTVMSGKDRNAPLLADTPGWRP